MKLQFKSERLGAEGLIELDLREGIEFTKFILENKKDLREFNLEALDHIEEIMVKLVEKVKSFKELDKQVQEIIKSGVKETVIPIIKEIPREEVIAKEDTVEEKKPEVDPKDLAIVLSGLINKL